MAQINLGGSIGVPGSVAVLGNVVINMTTSDYTMTTTDFSNKFVKVNGAIGANRNLIAPLNAGQEFVVWNNTTGGFSITVKGTTGTGVTIAPGNFITVVCDGANYQQTSGSGGGSFTAAGDLAGTPTNQEVIGIRTHTVPDVTGVTNGNGFLNWTGSAWSYNNPSGAVTLGGDVTGSAGSNTVQKIQGISISNAAISNGYVLTATGPSNAAFQPGLVFAGDLAGNLTTQSVIGLQNVPVSSTPSPTTGQVLQFNTTISGKWAPASLPTLAGDITGAITSNSVSKLQGYTLLIASTPNNGDVLTYNTAFSRWSPAPTSGVFVASNDLTGTSTSQTVVSAQSNAIAFGTSSGITFASNYLFPNLSQANVTTASATGKSMAIGAQNATGTTSTGGSLTLTSGSGTSTNGQVFIEVGGTTAINISTATTSIASTNVQFSAFTTGIPQFGSSGFITSYPATITGTPSTGQVLTATSSVIGGVRVLDWETPSGGSSVTWANDLAGSTNTNQYLAAISGPSGAGGTVPFFATTLSWGASQTTAEIIQTQASATAGPGNGANGTTFTLQAQAGQGATGGNNGGAGGNLVLAAGNSGSAIVTNINGNAGSVTIQAGTSGSGSGNGGNITLQAGAAGSGTQGSVNIFDGSATQEIAVTPTDIKLIATGASALAIIDVQSDRTTFQGGMYYQLTSVTSSPYTVDLGTAPADYFLACNNAGALTVNIRGAAYPGRQLVITDTSGAASTNHITIQATSPSANINGASTYVINTNYGSVVLMSDGSNWFVVAKA